MYTLHNIICNLHKMINKIFCNTILTISSNSMSKLYKCILYVLYNIITLKHTSSLEGRFVIRINCRCRRIRID